MGRTRQVAKAVAAANDRLRPRPRGLVILIYHRVGRRSTLEVDLPTDLFARQVEFLARECEVVSLDEGLQRLETPQSPRKIIVAVTFDDGTDDFVDVAFPLLARSSIPVTLYPATSFLDSGSELPDGGRPASWASLRDAHTTGLLEIGSHTHRHALLDRLAPTQIAGELDQSIESIASHIGAPPRHFAYPKALRGSPAAREAVQARFRSAALAGCRANRFGATDVYALARSPIQASDGMRWFRHKARGGLALEDVFRRALNTYRYRGSDC
jgi:peptidoglycan/xylan/chitin deacetylase (PgdA/CDA1 family)